MSIKTLLETDTKLEQWSTLNCYHLTAANIFADSIEHGALAPTSNQIANSDITLSVGNGTPADSLSLFSRYRSGASGIDEYVFGTGSFRLNAADAPQISANRCLFLVEISLPFKMADPASGSFVGGGTSCVCRDSVGNILENVGINLVNNASNLRMEVYVNGNVSAPSASRSISIQYQIHYKRL